MKPAEEILKNPAIRVVDFEMDADHYAGRAFVKSDQPGQHLQIIFSTGMRWDHVSACAATLEHGPCRIPSYHEMKRIKRLFFRDDETAMELHVPTAEHINDNDHVLHLWRPQDHPIPMPPKSMV